MPAGGLMYAIVTIEAARTEPWEEPTLGMLLQAVPDAAASTWSS